MFVASLAVSIHVLWLRILSQSLTMRTLVQYSSYGSNG